MFSLTPYNRRNRGISEIEKMFDSMFSDLPQLPQLEGFDLRVDITEDDESYTIYADLPGVKKEDINIEIKEDILTLSVTRDEKYEEKKDDYIRKERKYGSFKRSFYIDDVDIENIKAKLDEGILKIKLKKKESKDDTSIKIEVD